MLENAHADAALQAGLDLAVSGADSGKAAGSSDLMPCARSKLSSLGGISVVFSKWLGAISLGENRDAKEESFVFSASSRK